MEMPVGPEAEKIRMARDFILEKSKPKTVAVEQVKPKGTHSQQRNKPKKQVARKEGGCLIKMN